MRTTSIVVEHLAIGIQTAFWMVATVAAIYGYEWMLIPTPMMQVLVAAIALLVVYPLGVFTDELSDFCFRRWSKRIRKKYDLPDKQTAFVLLLRLKDPATSQYFQYLRGRIRLARSSALNFFLLTCASLFFTQRQLAVLLGEMTASVIVAELIIGVILTGLSLFTWRRVSDTFAKRIKWGYDALEALTDTGTKSRRRKE